MNRTIVEEYKDGELIKRTVTEIDDTPVNQEWTQYSPWWGIYPPSPTTGGKTITVTDFKTGANGE